MHPIQSIKKKGMVFTMPFPNLLLEDPEEPALFLASVLANQIRR